MLTYTGTVNFDKGIDSAALPAHLAACFRHQMDTRTIKVAGNRVTFRGSVSVPFRFVELTVDCAARAVRYRLSLRWLILAATIWLIAAAAGGILRPSDAGDPPTLVVLTWLWFGGTFLFGAILIVTAIPRFQRLVRRAVASAPAKPH